MLQQMFFHLLKHTMKKAALCSTLLLSLSTTSDIERNKKTDLLVEITEKKENTEKSTL